MTNPILSALNPMSQTGNNPMQMITAFAKFKQQMAGKDPEAMVRELVASGKMTQEQLAQLKEQAASLMTILR